MEELFRSLFEQFSVNPSPGLWKRVQSRIAWKEFLSFSLNAFNVYYLALVMALAGAGTLYLLPRMERTDTTVHRESTPPADVIGVGPVPESPTAGNDPPAQASSGTVKPARTPAKKKAAGLPSPPVASQEEFAETLMSKQLALNREEGSGPADGPGQAVSASVAESIGEALILRARADFRASPLSGCAPLAVSFQNLSEYAASFSWNFGDGGNSTEADPSYVFDEAGEFLVTLKVAGADGQENTKQQKVRVFETPKALFEFDEDVKPAANQPIYFYNYSRGGDHYEWDFGDSQRSGLQEPTHFYHGPGNYDVKLKVWTEHQCYDSLVIYNAFTTQEQQMKVPNAFTPNLDGPTGGYYDANDLNNTVFHPVTDAELLEYQLKVFNRRGVLLFESKDITIGWDGYYQEQLLKQDVYIWKIRGKFSNGKTFVESGDVTLIKQY
jgi:gliding motility-associated-like protein